MDAEVSSHQKAKKREKQRLASRKHYHKVRGPAPARHIDDFSYRVVPKTWRKEHHRRTKYETVPIDSPLITDLFAGRTLFVDIEVPLGARGSNPFRTLYPYMNNRGYHLRSHVHDDVTSGEYRRMLIWLEPITPAKINDVEL